MNLYNSIDSYCTNYAIPLTSDTVGYLQFYNSFKSIGALDINTIKYYQIDTFGIETEITALNTIGQYLGSNNFQTVTQGLQLTEMQNFRIKMVLIMNNGDIKTFYSDMFTFDQCGTSYALIPCLVEGQQYSVNDNFIGEITGNIVYQSWLIPTDKKYTPVAFIRNLSFNQRTNTIEYKKLNNKPLRTTLKKDYKLKSELIPESYIDTINEVFSFGKVNLLNKTFAFDTYSIEAIDENDCCSLYKINATAYIESKLRLLCSNNCTILSPVNCDGYIANNKVISIYPCKRTLNETGAFIEDITEQFLTKTGLDISEVQNLIDSGASCKFIEVIGESVIATLTELYNTCTINYDICGVQNTLTVRSDTYLYEGVPIISNADFVSGAYKITGTFSGQYEVLFTDLDTNISDVYGAIFNTENECILNLPEGIYRFQIRTFCNAILSNTFNTNGSCNIVKVVSMFAYPNPSGGCTTVIFKPDPNEFDNWLIWTEENKGQVFELDLCIDFNIAQTVCGNRISIIYDHEFNCCN